MSEFEDILKMIGISRSIPYRYWLLDVPRKHYMFSYTTERDSKGYYWAQIYKRVGETQHYNIYRRVRFARKKVAKARAYKWYTQSKPKPVPKYTDVDWL